MMRGVKTMESREIERERKREKENLAKVSRTVVRERASKRTFGRCAYTLTHRERTVRVRVFLFLERADSSFGSYGRYRAVPWPFSRV